MIRLILAAWVFGCPPLYWDPSHPNDCRNTATNATVIGVCCDQLRLKAEGPLVLTDADCQGDRHYSADCLVRSVRSGRFGRK
jgi:hypothetical protein